MPNTNSTMSRSTLQLVIFVSMAHALVHMYELALPSIEMELAAEYRTDQQEAKELSGWLSNVWRLPWGLGALVACWLVDW